MNDDYLKKFGIHYLHYMTHMDNVASILGKGILSYNLISQLKIKRCDIAATGVQQIRNKKIILTNRSLHEYVPLYFATQTPMQYVITQPVETRGVVCPTKHLVFLDLDASQVFRHPGVIFSDGNAARLSETLFYSDPADLDKLDWATINCPGDYHGSLGMCYKREWQRKKSSEVLVPEKIPPKYISRIVVYDENVAEELANKMQAASMELCHPIKCDKKTVSKYYF